jgi:23S rRNA (adenine2503-C2)-methyltransferase
MEPQTNSIYELSFEEIKVLLADLNEAPYRARQIWEWLYKKNAVNWQEMSNLPKALRTELAKKVCILPLEFMEKKSEAETNLTTAKLLFKLKDEDFIECVAIPSASRITLCVSTQVGCKFGCAFCASGMSGFKRNLLASEIISQLPAASHILKMKPTHIVIMGMGEPLDNYEATIQAIKTFNDAEKFAIGARRITISTCGIVPGIERLASENIQIELSVSLHAPDNELRDNLMRVNKLYPLEKLIPACRTYFEGTGRLITFEYVLIKGINDSFEMAKKLVKLVKGIQCRFNLIPLSKVPEFNFTAPSRRECEQFASFLEKAGFNVTIRFSKGSNINAACGQLRAERTMLKM